MIASRCAKPSLGSAHRLRALTGFQNRRYAQLSRLERSPFVSASQLLRVLRAVICRPGGVLRLWLMSGALRMVLISGFAVYVVFAPARSWGSLASQHRPRGLPVRPQGGSLRTARRLSCVRPSTPVLVVRRWLLDPAQHGTFTFHSFQQVCTAPIMRRLLSLESGGQIFYSL